MLQKKKMLNEGLEQNDLRRLVLPELHIDEFKSKMGNDEDIVVLSFKVAGKEPALDLVSFIEKGYDWVIDSDISSGEMEDGDYLVFVECDRTPQIPKQIISLIDDVLNLTEQEMSDWSVVFRSTAQSFELTEENIATNLALTPGEYLRQFGKKELDEMRSAAGVSINTKAPINDYTQTLKSLAGII